MFAADGSMSVTYDLYRDLELRPPCTVEDITRAYKRLALKYHPDKVTGSTEKFQKIKRANEILKDPLKKEFYDKFGDKYLYMIAPEGVEAKVFGGNSGLFGRMALKIMIRPILLIPIFLAIASLGIMFVMFLSRLDQKLYFSEYKNTPWYSIFTLLWVVLAFAIILAGFYLWANLRAAKSLSEKIFEFGEYQDIPAPRKRFLTVVDTIKNIMSAFEVFLNILMLLYLSVGLAFNMDDNGNLMNGFTWTKLFFLVVFFSICFGHVNIILCVASVLRYNQPNRMWKQRILVVSNELLASISSVCFINYLGNWLDSPDKNQMKLFLIFSLIYLRILFYGYRVRCESNWAAEDEIKNFLQRKPSSNSQEEFEKKFRQHKKAVIYFICIFVFIVGISTGLIHSHIAIQWPKTWSATFFPILFCVYTSIFVFGCCCPFIVCCMNLVTPQNSFHTFAFVPTTATGEERVTIIEISSFYRFGYGLAPIQRRITYPNRY